MNLVTYHCPVCKRELGRAFPGLRFRVRCHECGMVEIQT